MNVTAVARRSGGWWAVEVPEVEGVFTQARRLDQVPHMVTDAVAALLEVDPSTIQVTLAPHTDADDIVAAAREAKAQADAANARASDATRQAVHALLSASLTVRDAGTLLGVSPQRVSQLANGGPA
ncbi:XRE family transcriptional regulator [Desertihabitans brevis]|uniref:XRE family transcriptional regulator n=1 Tax=Desertihabitans brevis TaxID=2268447 RepID=A0A367YRU8_9ACTN|nr:XRE family transcriptional regulator [Desertihabitans brevis]RCK68279.1 XRE family transcriptional regulator [Desertihabitans brevis]